MTAPEFFKAQRFLLVLGALCVVFFTSSCKKDPVTGALEVNVIGTLGNPVAGSEVLLEGISDESFLPKSVPSDNAGKALFEFLPFGTYQALVTTKGRTIALPISVTGDSIHHVFVQVDDLPGRNPGLYPIEYPNPVLAADSIYFSAIVDDDRTPASQILVKWKHIINNEPVEIYSDFAAAFNEVSFFYGGLNVGVNQFTVIAIDGDGRSTYKYLTVIAE